MKRNFWVIVMMFVLALPLAVQAGLKVDPKSLATDYHLSGKDVLDILDSGSLEILVVILQANPDAWKVRDENGATPLHMAVISNNFRAVQLLLPYVKDIEQGDVKGWTALHYAVAGRRLPIAEFLLDQGANENARDLDGNTPLHFAVGNGQFGMVKMLKDRGAKLALLNRKGEAPLDWASQGHVRQVCEKLLGKAAVPTSTVKQERGPSGNVAPKPVEPKKLQTSEPNRVNEIVDLMQRDQVQVIQAMVTENPSLLSSRDELGATIFHAAVFLGKSDVVRNLLQVNANLEIQDNDGWTPLHYAVAAKREEMVAVLLAHGANPFSRDKKGLSPIRMATHEIASPMSPLLFRVALNNRVSVRQQPMVAGNRVSPKVQVAEPVSAHAGLNTDRPKVVQASFKSYSNSDTGKSETTPVAVSEGSEKRNVAAKIAAHDRQTRRHRRHRGFLRTLPVVVLAAFAARS